MASQKEPLVKFREMFSTCHTCYKFIGIRPLFHDVPASKWWTLFFWLSFWNLFLTYLGELVFIGTTFGEFGSFLKLVALFPCTSYGTVTVNGMIVVAIKRSRLVAIIKALEGQFPTNLDQQRVNQIARMKRQFDLPLQAYFGAFVVLIATFNCTPLLTTLVNYIHHGVWEKSMPYFVWYPFNEYDDRYFLFLYLLQFWAGITTVFGMMADLLMMGACVLQFCIQFKLIASSVREYRPNKATDKEFLEKIVTQHNFILTNAKEFASILSSGLFFHHTCASIVICCVGFQVVAGDDLKTKIMFLEFFVCSLIQTIVVSYFGNEIIENVSQVSLL